MVNFYLITLGGALVFCAAAIAMAVAIRQVPSIWIKLILGILMAFFGLIALGLGACGTLVLRS